MSITFFSVFSPNIFQVEIKNNFLPERNNLLSAKSKQKNLLEKLNTEHNLYTSNKNIISKPKTKYFRTSGNLNTNYTNINTNIGNNSNIRDIISSKEKTKLKLKSTNKKHKYSLYQALGEKVQPYKQYLIEKRRLEKIKKEKIRYKNELKKQKDLSALPPKHKIKGINFATQKGFGFFDQYAESKNYRKEKIKNKKPVFIIKRKKFDEFDANLFEDIKSGKRKNVFEEKFDVKSLLRYGKLRQSAFGFLKYLNDSPIFNF